MQHLCNDDYASIVAFLCLYFWAIRNHSFRLRGTTHIRFKIQHNLLRNNWLSKSITWLFVMPSKTPTNSNEISLEHLCLSLVAQTRRKPSNFVLWYFKWICFVTLPINRSHIYCKTIRSLFTLIYVSLKINHLLIMGEWWSFFFGDSSLWRENLPLP
jgi:hypothetical protein